MRFEIDVRKVRLPEHEGFSQHRLDHLGEWEVEVILVDMPKGPPSFAFVYQDYAPTQPEAVEMGHEFIRQEMRILNEHHRAMGS